MQQKKTGKLFLLASPSGGGKTTLANALIEQVGSLYDLSRVVTYTTRPPRSQEKHGIDYHFVSQVDFQAKIEQQFFLEWSAAYGCHYGTPGDIITHVEGGRSYIAVVDRAGVRSISQAYQKSVAIWIEVSNPAVLEERLKRRASESPEQLRHRLLLAQQELAEEQFCDLYKYRLINDELGMAIKALQDIIIGEITASI